MGLLLLLLLYMTNHAPHLAELLQFAAPRSKPTKSRHDGHKCAGHVTGKACQ